MALDQAGEASCAHRIFSVHDVLADAEHASRQGPGGGMTEEGKGGINACGFMLHALHRADEARGVLHPRKSCPGRRLAIAGNAGDTCIARSESDSKPHARIRQFLA